MSFTDQKQRVFTEEDTKVKWGLRGKSLRCSLCAHEMKPGDKWRWIWATGRTYINPISNKPFNVCNLTVCEPCDTPDALDKWVERNIEFYGPKFDALRDT